MALFQNNVMIWGTGGLDLNIWIFSSVQSFSHIQLLMITWIAAHQASLSIINSRSLPKLMIIKSAMLSSHLIFCRPLLLLLPIPPNIKVFSNEWTLRMRWPKYWSFSFSISPSNEHPGLISFRMDWLDLLQPKGLSRVFPNTTVQKPRYFILVESIFHLLLPWENKITNVFTFYSVLSCSVVSDSLWPHGL